MFLCLCKFSQFGNKRKEGVRGTKHFLWKNGLKLSHYERKLSKVATFREQVPTSCQIIRGILIFLFPPLTSCQIWLWSPTHQLHQEKQKKNIVVEVVGCHIW
jgi:hypothetical protein